MSGQEIKKKELDESIIKLYVVESPYDNGEKQYILSDREHYALYLKDLERIGVDDEEGYLRLFTHLGGSSRATEIGPSIKIPDTTKTMVGQYLGESPHKTLEIFLRDPDVIYTSLRVKRATGKYGAPLPLSARGIKNRGLVLEEYKISREAYVIIKQITEESTKKSIKKTIDAIFENN